MRMRLSGAVLSFLVLLAVGVGAVSRDPQLSVSRLRSLYPEEQPGVRGLRFSEVAGLKPLPERREIVLKFIRRIAGTNWNSFYAHGRKRGYSKLVWREENPGGDGVIVRESLIVFPGMKERHRFVTRFGRDGVIRGMEYSQVKRLLDLKVILRREGAGWIASVIRNGEQKRDRTIPKIRETLFNNDLAFRALLAAGELKPGDRFSIPWFSPRKLRDMVNGAQYLGRRMERFEKRDYILHSTESLSPDSRQNWKHIIGRTGIPLISRYKSAMLVKTGRERALSSGKGLPWQFLIILVVAAFFLISPIRDWLRRRGSGGG